MHYTIIFRNIKFTLIIALFYMCKPSNIYGYLSIPPRMHLNLARRTFSAVSDTIIKVIYAISVNEYKVTTINVIKYKSYQRSMNTVNSQKPCPI